MMMLVNGEGRAGAIGTLLSYVHAISVARQVTKATGLFEAVRRAQPVERT